MSDSKLIVPAGKTVYWRGLTYTEGMLAPSDYPEPDHLKSSVAATTPEDSAPPRAPREK